MKKQYRDFESAREFAQSLGLKNQKEWREYCKSGNKPDDIPQKVERTYKNDFKGFGDWLGTGTIAPRNQAFRSFKDARDFVRALNLKGTKEWQEYCKSGNKPDDIPSAPHGTYKNKFKGSGDWLGTGRTRDWRSFEEAREFARSLNLKGYKEWQEYCKSGNKPGDIPCNPNTTYKKDFKGMRDFVGNETVAPQDRVFHPYKEAREFVKLLNLKTQKEWQEYCKSGNKPDDIPSAPPTTYKKDWKGWGEFLGTGTVASKDKAFRSFKKAREFVRSLGLKNQKEWLEYVKSGNKPDDIPTYPWVVYKEWNIKRRAEKK
jgi:hypothetical protein